MQKNYPFKHFKKIVIIIPTTLGGDRVIRCIKSIKELAYPQEQIKIVVIDNKTPDKIYLKIRKDFPKVKTIINKKNLGFSKAVNMGINSQKSDYYFITNDDIIFQKESLGTLVEFMERNPEVGICGGKQLLPNSGKFLAGGRNFSFFTGQQSNIKGKNQPIFCDQVDGCSMLISRSVVNKIGLFDEGFVLAYGEDLDYCIRAKKAGFKIAYHPKSIFFHEYAATTSSLPLEDIYYIGFKNKLRVIIKHANPLQLIVFILFHFLLVLPYRIIWRKEPIVIPEIKAVIWNLNNFRNVRRFRK